jgi:signal transduction histidine kinase
MTHNEADIHILLVDDRPENLLSLEAILSPLGHTLVRAGSGREALKVLLRHDFAVILLDVQMPGIDGFETAELIRGRERSQNTPILFLTAVNTDENHVFRGYEVGAVDYLLKPIVPTVLLSKVSVFVDLYKKSLKVSQQAAQLEQTVAELEREIARRKVSEQALRAAHSQLELRVRERTADLSAANEALRHEVAERQRAEHDLADALGREQAAREEAEVAVRVRDHFLAVASHELKTPLTAIYGNVQLLRRRLSQNEHVDERNRRSIEVAVEQTARLSRMIEMLLDISRIQTGMLTISRSQLDIGQVLRRVVQELEAGLERHRIELALRNEPLIIDGDELRLEQVLHNLINNAIKYRPGGGRVDVCAERHNGHLEIAVSDQGIGIPASAVPYIFQHFYRADNADRRNIEGMGIGLYVVHEVIALHGGQIDVASQEGEGSTFTVTLPIESGAT